MTTLLARSSLPLPVDRYQSFHSIYDFPEYASIFGGFQIVTYDGNALIFRSVNQIATSGPGASFGGILFNSDYIYKPKLSMLKEMVDGISIAIRNELPLCINTCIRLAPDIYYPGPFIQTLHAAFAIAGWSNIGEITHVVCRDSYRPRNSTLRNAHKARRCCVLRRIEPDLCFDFLSEIKLQKGYRFNYDRRRFLEQFETFPDLFSCFGVQTAKDNLIAASFELATHNWGLLLNWDQTAEGKSIGATDYLLLERLENLFGTGRRFVDMGTITDGRKANWGLARHKQNFGGHALVRSEYLSASWGNLV